MNLKSEHKTQKVINRNSSKEPHPLSVIEDDENEVKKDIFPPDYSPIISIIKDPAENQKYGSHIRTRNSNEGTKSSSTGKFSKRSNSDNDVMSLLEEMGIGSEDDLTGKTVNNDKKGSSHLRIHREVENTMQQYYLNDGLTVVSEEQSKQFTEYNFGKPKNESSGVRTEFSNSVTKGSRMGSGYLGRSIDDGGYINKFRQSSGSRSSIESAKGVRSRFMTQQSKQGPFLHRKSSLDANQNSKSDFNEKLSNSRSQKDKIRQSLGKIMKKELPTIKSSQVVDGIASVEIENMQISNRNFKSNEIQVKTLKPRKSSQRPSHREAQFDTSSLPAAPPGPEYVIDMLANVKSSKKIDKKQHMIKDAFFRLPCGLFYEGNLSFGKLQGIGILLLKCIDASDRSSPDVKKSLLYEGCFFNNEVEGKGKLRFRDGKQFVGSFKNGVAHGTGQMLDFEGKLLFEGVWINGKYCH